ncbi:MAG TPA: hypothetical protein VGH27_29135 [Streptosporangiaceae bacterium]|jgi:hypothetical protein
MGLMTHYCRECGQDQLFDQPHDTSCEVDGDCPEWACPGCGTALFTGFPGLIIGRSDAGGGQRPRQAA